MTRGWDNRNFPKIYHQRHRRTSRFLSESFAIWSIGWHSISTMTSWFDPDQIGISVIRWLVHLRQFPSLPLPVQYSQSVLVIIEHGIKRPVHSSNIRRQPPYHPWWPPRIGMDDMLWPVAWTGMGSCLAPSYRRSCLHHQTQSTQRTSLRSKCKSHRQAERNDIESIPREWRCLQSGHSSSYDQLR